jgi:ribose transport system permease protein
MTMSEQNEPRILATVIGVLILGVLDNGLTQMAVDSYVRQILVGGIIVLAVAMSSISRRRR